MLDPKENVSSPLISEEKSSDLRSPKSHVLPTKSSPSILTRILNNKWLFLALSVLFIGLCASIGYFLEIVSGDMFGSVMLASLSALVVTAISYTASLRSQKSRSGITVASILALTAVGGLYAFYEITVGLSGMRLAMGLTAGALAGFLVVAPLVRQLGSALKKYPWVPKVLIGPVAIGLGLLGYYAGGFEKSWLVLWSSPLILIGVAVVLAALAYGVFTKPETKAVSPGEVGGHAYQQICDDSADMGAEPELAAGAAQPSPSHSAHGTPRQGQSPKASSGSRRSRQSASSLDSPDPSTPLSATTLAEAAAPIDEPSPEHQRAPNTPPAGASELDVEEEEESAAALAAVAPDPQKLGTRVPASADAAEVESPPLAAKFGPDLPYGEWRLPGSAPPSVRRAADVLLGGDSRSEASSDEESESSSAPTSPQLPPPLPKQVGSDPSKVAPVFSLTDTAAGPSVLASSSSHPPLSSLPGTSAGVIGSSSAAAATAKDTKDTDDSELDPVDSDNEAEESPPPPSPPLKFLTPIATASAPTGSFKNAQSPPTRPLASAPSSLTAQQLGSPISPFSAAKASPASRAQPQSAEEKLAETRAAAVISTSAMILAAATAAGSPLGSLAASATVAAASPKKDSSLAIRQPAPSSSAGKTDAKTSSPAADSAPSFIVAQLEPPAQTLSVAAASPTQPQSASAAVAVAAPTSPEALAAAAAAASPEPDESKDDKRDPSPEPGEQQDAEVEEIPASPSSASARDPLHSSPDPAGASARSPLQQQSAGSLSRGTILAATPLSPAAQLGAASGSLPPSLPVARVLSFDQFEAEAGTSPARPINSPPMGGSPLHPIEEVASVETDFAAEKSGQPASQQAKSAEGSIAAPATVSPKKPSGAAPVSGDKKAESRSPAAPAGKEMPQQPAAPLPHPMAASPEAKAVGAGSNSSSRTTFAATTAALRSPQTPKPASAAEDDVQSVPPSEEKGDSAPFADQDEAGARAGARAYVEQNIAEFGHVENKLTEAQIKIIAELIQTAKSSAEDADLESIGKTTCRYAQAVKELCLSATPNSSQQEAVENLVKTIYLNSRTQIKHRPTQMLYEGLYMKLKSDPRSPAKSSTLESQLGDSPAPSTMERKTTGSGSPRSAVRMGAGKRDLAKSVVGSPGDDVQSVAPSEDVQSVARSEDVRSVAPSEDVESVARSPGSGAAASPATAKTPATVERGSASQRAPIFLSPPAAASPGSVASVARSAGSAAPASSAPAKIPASGARDSAGRGQTFLLPAAASPGGSVTSVVRSPVASASAQEGVSPKQ